MLKSIGTTALLWGLVVCFLAGAIVTHFFRIETTGVNLEDVGKERGTGQVGNSHMRTAAADWAAPVLMCGLNWRE